MEPLRFKPYNFEEPSEIFDLHIRQVNRHLTRYVFTEDEYRTKNLPKTWHKFRKITMSVIFETILITGLTLAYLNKNKFFKNYNLVLGTGFGVKSPEKLSFSYLVVIIGVCDAIYFTHYCCLKYKAYFLIALYDLRANINREISSKTIRKRFVLFFKYASFQTGINLKLAGIGMFYVVGHIARQSYVFYAKQILSFSQASSIVAFFAATQIEFYEVQYLIYALLCGLFFVLKSYKYKSRICMKLLVNIKKKPVKNIGLLNLYSKNLMILHRAINYYNEQIREYNFVMDTIGKVAGGWAIINAFKTPDGFNLLFLIFFIGLYLYSHFMGVKMSFFKQILPLMATDLHIIACHFSESFTKRSNILKNSLNKTKVYVLLKIEKNIDFLSCGTNHFGFTYAKQYHYTKFKVVENTLMFGYALMLIVKRSRSSEAIV